MTTRAVWDPSTVSLATLAPTRRQRRSALAIAAAVLVAWGAIAPFGDTHFPPMNGFIPATEAVLVVCDLMIAALLAGQAVTIGSRALVLLAGGFLFDALIIIPHILTFPGAFMPSGLFGAGLQTTAWLFIFWHFGLPAAVIGYACRAREPRAVTIAVLFRDAVLVVGSVVLLTWIVTAYGDAIPALFVDKLGFTPLANQVTAFDFSLSVVALIALLARRQKSVLDLWLIVAVAALVAELAVTTFIIKSRFSLGFYASRILSMGASTIVLIALFAESVRQGLRLARTNLALQLERSRKLTSLDAVLGMIAHEVRQPLTSIAHNAEAAQLLLGRATPDVNALREIVEDILNSGFRADEVFRNVRELFKDFREDLQAIDLNKVIIDVLHGLQAEMAQQDVAAHIELERELPNVRGHKGQLQEVIFNLLQNALDAMRGGPVEARSLSVRTERRGAESIVISVQDSGQGIAPGQIARIFDPFVTTKKNGMGLGLAICRVIVERHGGQLSASSDVNAGALFRIELPIDTDSPATESRPDVIGAIYPRLFLRHLGRGLNAFATGMPVLPEARRLGSFPSSTPAPTAKRRQRAG